MHSHPYSRLRTGDSLPSRGVRVFAVRPADDFAREPIISALAVPGLILLMYRRIPVSLYLAVVAATYPLIYYVVVSDVRYRYPVLWLSLLSAGYLLAEFVRLVAVGHRTIAPVSRF